MCGSKPKAPPPPPPPPPPPQEVKAPDVVDRRRRNTQQQVAAFSGLPGGTLLTGASGAGAANTGSTLLGGM